MLSYTPDCILTIRPRIPRRHDMQITKSPFETAIGPSD
jgi:hypothetical protein